MCFVYTTFTFVHLRFDRVPFIRVLVGEGHLTVLHIRELDATLLQRVRAHDGGDEDPCKRHPGRVNMKWEARWGSAKADEDEVEEWRQLGRHRHVRVLRVVEDPPFSLRRVEAAQLRPQVCRQVDDEAHHCRRSRWHRDGGDVDVVLREPLCDELVEVVLGELPRLLLAHCVDVRRLRYHHGAPAELELVVDPVLLGGVDIAQQPAEVVLAQLRAIFRNCFLLFSHIVVPRRVVCR